MIANFTVNRFSKIIWLIILLLLSGLIILGTIQVNSYSRLPIDPEAQRVLVIANRKSPVSLRVAQYYMQRRSIHPANLLTLDLPDSTLVPALESITYSTYQSQIERPLREFLTRHKLTDRIRYIVLTRGIPLRIKNVPYQLDGKSRLQIQSIDSTLAALDYQIPPIAIRDPDYEKQTGEEFFGLLTPNLYWRQTYAFKHSLTGGYLVTRLDGYREADARALVDRALTPRPTLTGNILLDSAGDGKNNGEPNVVDIFDPVACTPQTIPNCKPLPRAMIEAPREDNNNDLRLTLNSLAPSFTQLRIIQADPRTFVTGQNLMAYASWGSNDDFFRIENYHNLQFLPGAIAETFVSSSGRTFFPTSTGQSLIGDLISHGQGVTGIRGYIDEPELQGMGSPNILFDSYLRGANLATAYYQSIRFVGWRDIILGDPLATAVFKP